MRSRIQDRNIWIVYGAIFLLGLAYGTAISLVSVFLDERHVSEAAIGWLAAAFASGIVAFSLPMGALIRRFSARAMLVISLVGYAGAVAVFPHLDSYAAIAVVRFVDGACSVGIWVSCETILLSRASAQNKAFVTSLYAISMAVGYILGPFAARGIVSVAPMYVAFLASGVMATLSAALVVARLDADVASTHADAAHGGVRLPLRTLLAHVRTSLFATFAYGYFESAVVLFLPLYLMREKHVSKPDTIILPAFFALGMLLFSNVFGRIGDRVGHLGVMRRLALVGALTTAAFVLVDTYWMMCAITFVAGAVIASISPLSLALQGVVVPAADYARANAIYNAFYASGMLLGPPISGRILKDASGRAMILHFAVLWAVFALFALVFRRDDPQARRR